MFSTSSLLNFSNLLLLLTASILMASCVPLNYAKFDIKWDLMSPNGTIWTWMFHYSFSTYSIIWKRSNTHQMLKFQLNTTGSFSVIQLGILAVPSTRYYKSKFSARSLHNITSSYSRKKCTGTTEHPTTEYSQIQDTSNTGRNNASKFRTQILME